MLTTKSVFGVWKNFPLPCQAKVVNIGEYLSYKMVPNLIRVLSTPEKHWGAGPASWCELVPHDRIMLGHTPKISANLFSDLCSHEASSFLRLSV